MSAAEWSAPVAEAKPLKSTGNPAPRLWPPVVLAVGYWLAWAVVMVGFPGTFVQFMTLFYAPMVLALGMVIWWLAFSRVPWISRVWAVGVLLACFGVAYLLTHKSVNWMGLLMYGLPIALSAAVVWLLLTRGAKTLPGWLGLAALFMVTLGYFDLLRIDGITGALVAERSWRWTETAEERFLAAQKRRASEQPDRAPEVAQASALVAGPGDWTDFRGPSRDGHVHNVSFNADWKTQPPKELWRRLVGPGWSSFAVVGDRCFTQEQRGDEEVVICFDLSTGEEIWAHADKARFEDVVAGAGPRATPTFAGGKLYAQGAGGKLNCFDAATGKLLWSRDILKDAGMKAPPQWGFSSSPLVTRGVVMVFAGGEAEKIDEKTVEAGKAKEPSKADAPDKVAPTAKAADKPSKSLLCYDAETGEPRWTAGKGVHSYSSPQLATIGDTEQVLMETDRGVEAFDPATGKLLWDHDWFLQGMFRVCQPTVVEGNKVLVGTGMGAGTRLLSVEKAGAEWKVTENWTSKDLKPYFNDFVAQDGYLYGFDGNIFTCLDLATGKRQWKKGRFGFGQVLLVGEAGQAIIVSETGELVLVDLTPKNLVELACIPALKGKTWNHPVLTSGGKLLVRNGEEMACYDLAPKP